MPSFFQLPGGLPWWVGLAIVVPLALYGLLFLAMPFIVFGVKSRLEQMEARLDEIQEEIRGLAFRLPEPPQNAPVLPPASQRVISDPSEVVEPYQAGNRRVIPARVERSEPRLDWPR